MVGPASPSWVLRHTVAGQRRDFLGLPRTLLGVAADNRLLDATPFARVEIRPDDGSAARAMS